MARMRRSGFFFAFWIRRGFFFAFWIRKDFFCPLGLDVYVLKTKVFGVKVL